MKLYSVFSFISVFTFLKYFIYFWPLWVFVAMLGLSLSAVHEFLIAMASLVMEHGL